MLKRLLLVSAMVLAVLLTLCGCHAKKAPDDASIPPEVSEATEVTLPGGDVIEESSPMEQTQSVLEENESVENSEVFDESDEKDEGSTPEELEDKSGDVTTVPDATEAVPDHFYDDDELHENDTPIG